MKFFKGSVYIDADQGIITVEGSPVAKVYSDDFELKIEWLMESWVAWTELQDDPEFVEINQAAQDKLTSAKERMSKGKGKGDGLPGASA